jgi:sn-glycerol 3-phosphate transport system substrate-binding protein
MNAAGTQTAFSQRGAVEALQYWLDLARIHKVHPPGVVAWGSTPRDFRDEKVSMIWTTSGNLGALKADAGFDFGVAKLPAKLRRGSPTGGGNLYPLRRGRRRSAKPRSSSPAGW